MAEWLACLPSSYISALLVKQAQPAGFIILNVEMELPRFKEKFHYLSFKYCTIASLLTT